MPEAVHPAGRHPRRSGPEARRERVTPGQPSRDEPLSMATGPQAAGATPQPYLDVQPRLSATLTSEPRGYEVRDLR
jgi:hypothetical protein